jgi:chromosome segregation protein
MPARLKSFELHGYKTFAAKYEFIFSDGITAIVGPNGSGKSNIADALRWVLGEQSYGLLRGKKTEDMIFSGSENRPRAGMASATIIFDNSDGWLPIDFSEVGITRRAYRDGENEYLLNGQRVRLKDVSEILAKSGLAERTYTVIGQGLVDAALALRAEDRRRLFEEAAGIGLHRTRREEAIKRLEATGRNLERVQDILAELQPRLRSLERQAKKAQEYHQMKADLKVVLREWYGYHWHMAQSELVKAQIEAKQKEESLSEAQSNQLDLDQKISTYRSQINEIRVQLSDRHKQLTSLHQRGELLSREQAVNNERSRLLVQQNEQLSMEKMKSDEEIAIQKDQLEIANQELEQLEKELAEARLSGAEVVETLNNRRQARYVVEEKIQQLRREITAKNVQVTQLQARHTEKESHIQRLRSALLKEDRELSAVQEELASAQDQLKMVTRSNEEKENLAQLIQQELRELQSKLINLAQERSIINDQLASQKAIVAGKQAEKMVLEEAEKNFTGYEEGARILLQAVKDNQLEGAIGSLGNSLIVPEELEAAIATILGEYIDSLVIESLSQTDKALDLIENDSVRGSLFPLDAISATEPLSLALDKTSVDTSKVVGVAAELIKADLHLKPIIDLLFGQVIIVRDRKTAQSILSTSNGRKMANVQVVTLQGEMFLSSGPVIKGASRKGLLVRPRQQREIKAMLDQARALEGEYQENLTDIERRISDLKRTEDEVNQRFLEAEELTKNIRQARNQSELQVEKLQRNLQWHEMQKLSYQAEIEHEQSESSVFETEITKLTEEGQLLKSELDQGSYELEALSLEELVTQNTYWSTTTAVIEQALRDARARQQDKNKSLQQLEENLSMLKHRSIELELEINQLKEVIGTSSEEENRVANDIDRLSDLVTPLEERLNQLEKEQNCLLTSDADGRQALRSAEQQYTQAKIHLARNQESFAALRGHIEDDFGLVSFEYNDTVSGPKPLPLGGMVEELPVVETISPELEEAIRQQKAQIRRMGAVNPEAQNEYQEVKERFEFLTSQVNDLTKAEVDIREVITELDLLMEREFQRTFVAVAQEFKQIFTRLFGGGSARLALTDPENLTETGIDIEARLPGRREQGLSLLSGGERSLTAAALIFALLRVSPTPFCILDEVDAMLDEANVGRFRDLLTELSEQTQFIVITHNRNTVQAASIIYGITMGRDSTSQVISLRMDELGEEFGV